MCVCVFVCVFMCVYVSLHAWVDVPSFVLWFQRYSISKQWKGGYLKMLDTH